MNAVEFCDEYAVHMFLALFLKKVKNDEKNVLLL